MNSLIFRISIRNLLKNKFTFFVCVFGLSLGFIAFILISLFIRYEMSWDKFNENHDRIYLVQRNRGLSSRDISAGNISSSTAPLTASLVEEYPGVAKTALVREIQDRFLSLSVQEQYRVERGLYADAGYFDIFTYDFLDGHSSETFKEPYSIVISETLADRFFSPGEAVGSILTLDRKTDLKVSGVYADLPLNSSIRPDYIISLSTLERTEGISLADPWNTSFMTFLLIEPGTGSAAIEAGIRDLFAGYEGRELEFLILSPLSKMRFDSVPDYFTVIWIFGLIGIFILSMSAFNYVNLSMANASIRGKEIAVKKMNGSKRSQLIIQFLGETVLISAIAVGLSLYLVSFLIPFYNNMMNTAISQSYFGDWQFTGILIASSLAIGLLAGLYPALFLSSSSIVNLFKGSFRAGSDKIRLRKTLVLLQFAISVFLICLSIFFLRQVNHITGKDIGFERENLVYVQLTSTGQERFFDDFRSRLLQNPAITDASMSVNLPFVNFGGGSVNWEGGDNDNLLFYRPNRVTFDFVRTLGMQIVAGRDFSREYPSDIGQACIINETAARYFGWEDPIGMRLDNNMYTVIGVIKDYHVMDIHNIIDPVVLMLMPDEMQGDRTYAFRIAPGYSDEAIALLTSEFSREFPDDPFFLGDLDSAFRNETAFKGYQTLKKSMLFFTVFNILLAVTGLLGLVSFSVARRTKEVGIRKITGSSIASIFIILNREFFILLAISLVIAWPGVWMVYNAFPGKYKLPLHPWILLSSALIILVITLMTTAWQTWRAATRNPVEALRYE
jgi:putative ABC transport system permease protein